MTEKQLISNIRGLKQIKPKQNWVLLTKNQILSGNQRQPEFTRDISFRSVFSKVFNVFFQRKLAYALATILLMAGVLSFMNLMFFNGSTEIQEQVPSSVAVIKSSVEEFKAKSQNLVDVAKNKPQDFALAVKEVKKAAESLTEAIEKEPELAKEIALDIKDNGVLLSIVSEAEVEQASETLYKTIVDQIIGDVKPDSLTDEKRAEFDKLKESYEKGDYSGSVALEKILLIINK